MDDIDQRITDCFRQGDRIKAFADLCRTFDAEKLVAERERIAAIEELGQVVMKLEAAKDAIRKFGKHDPSCCIFHRVLVWNEDNPNTGTKKRGPCICGLEAALAGEKGEGDE